MTAQLLDHQLNIPDERTRPYLVKLLEEERIPFRRVGNRRRVLLTDLLAFKRTDDRERHVNADKLTAEAELLGLDY